MSILIQLSESIKKSIEESCEENTAVAFSGGIDSTTIATVAKNVCNVFLHSVGTIGSQDLEYAEMVAKKLSIPIQKHVVEENEVLSLYEKVYSIVPFNPFKIDILIPVYKVLECSNEDVILFGSGSEELFIGYDRYYRFLDEGKDLDSILKKEFTGLNEKGGDVWAIKQIAKKLKKKVAFPFYSRKIADIVFSIPVKERAEDRELKKGVLREAAALLKVPKEALLRRKKSMQYGSGVHKIIEKHKKELEEKFPQKLFAQ
ncbi:MAG: asparagine synthase C-terminal domain-containing protein [Candidatus Anstonellales archaeon]